MADVLLEKFVEDSRRLSSPANIVAEIDQFDNALRDIVNGVDGHEILETGCSLFRYLSEATECCEAEALNLWNAPKIGFPGHAHSDLLVPYKDVVNTQLLWLNTYNLLSDLSRVERVEIMLNVLFRWHIASVELMRKMLTFCEYWMRSSKGGIDENRLRNLLYGTGDPVPSLNEMGDKKIAKAATRFYNRDARHAIAHGNVVCNLPDAVVVRLTNKVDYRFVEKRYDLKRGSTGIDQIINDLHDPADRNYQAIRVFFFLYGYIDARHGAFTGKSWDRYLQDVTMIESLRSVHKN